MRPGAWVGREVYVIVVNMLDSVRCLMVGGAARRGALGFPGKPWTNPAALPRIDLSVTCAPEASFRSLAATCACHGRQVHASNTKQEGRHATKFSGPLGVSTT
jgi:hypothetical protein